MEKEGGMMFNATFNDISVIWWRLWNKDNNIRRALVIVSSKSSTEITNLDDEKGKKKF